MTEATNPGAEAEAAAPEVDDATLGTAEAPEGAETTETTTEEAEPHEEVEREGKKYRIPSALKGELLMHADYTKKTQEVSEARKAFEAEKTSFATASMETIQAAAKVQSIDERLAEYAKLTDADWDALSKEQPELYSQHWRTRTLLTEQRQKAISELQTKEREREASRQQTTAKAIGETQAVLARDIKGWGPDLAGKLTSFGKAQGLSEADLAAMNTRPELVKVLHLAFQGTQAGKTQAAAAQAQKSAAVAPTPKVGAASPPVKGLDDRLSMSEWMNRRTAQANGKR